MSIYSRIKFIKGRFNAMNFSFPIINIANIGECSKKNLHLFGK